MKLRWYDIITIRDCQSAGYEKKIVVNKYLVENIPI